MSLNFPMIFWRRILSIIFGAISFKCSSVSSNKVSASMPCSFIVSSTLSLIPVDSKNFSNTSVSPEALQMESLLVAIMKFQCSCYAPLQLQKNFPLIQSSTVWYGILSYSGSLMDHGMLTLLSKITE